MVGTLQNAGFGYRVFHLFFQHQSPLSQSFHRENLPIIFFLHLLKKSEKSGKNAKNVKNAKSAKSAKCAKKVKKTKNAKNAKKCEKREKCEKCEKREKCEKCEKREKYEKCEKHEKCEKCEKPKSAKKVKKTKKTNFTMKTLPKAPVPSTLMILKDLNETLSSFKLRGILSSSSSSVFFPLVKTQGLLAFRFSSGIKGFLPKFIVFSLEFALFISIVFKVFLLLKVGGERFLWFKGPALLENQFKERSSSFS